MKTDEKWSYVFDDGHHCNYMDFFDSKEAALKAGMKEAKSERADTTTNSYEKDGTKHYYSEVTANYVGTVPKAAKAAAPGQSFDDMGNIIKYLYRYPKKGTLLSDLAKTEEYTKFLRELFIEEEP